MVEVRYKEAFGTVCKMLKPITENCIFEATTLCCHIIMVSQIELITSDLFVEKDTYDRLIEATTKRIEGYPLQYIIGEWAFYGRTYEVGTGVLIPRADTETLIDVVKEYASYKERLKVVDLCSGSGCIAITLAKELLNPNVHAIEKSEVAYEYLLKNIKRNDAAVKACLADIFQFDEQLQEIDIIVSNPPYLTKEDMQTLQKEVQFEPKMALFGEEDGLYFYREITKTWSKRLKIGGLLAYEIGKGQQDAVTTILQENGFKTICQKVDLCDIIRVVYGIKESCD